MQRLVSVLGRRRTRIPICLRGRTSLVEPSAASAAAAAQRQRCFWKFSRMRRAEASLQMTRPQPRHRRRHLGPARPPAYGLT